MKLILKHMDELDSSEFTKLLFRLDETNYIKLTDANPILDLISMAINRFNNKNKKLFRDSFKDINNDAKELGLIEVNINNVYEIRNILGVQIERIDTRIKEVEEGDYSFVLSSYDDKYINEDQLDIDLKIHSFCNMITDNGYSNMDKKTRDEFFSDLYEIMDIIIKLKIFSRVSDEYLKYSEDNGYNDISGEWLLLSDNQREMVQKINDKKKVIKVEKSKPFARLNKKKISYLEYELDRLEKELIDINKKIEECSKKKSFYIIGFVNKLVKSGKFYDIEGFDSVSKLFGVFDFEMLPLTSNKVSNMKLFKKYSIKLPDMYTEKFDTLSIDCLKFINSSIFIERKRNNLRIMSLANDVIIDDIAGDRFAHLIDTVSDEQVKTVVKKR